MMNIKVVLSKLGGVERKFRLPRLWSNEELRKIAPLVDGGVINVSGWKDEDKEGGHYRDYFTRASSYSISNWNEGARGWQGDKPNEILLNLEQPLPTELRRRYDVALCHTVLEHVFDVATAFRNVAAMSSGAVVIVVPFMQERHSSGFGDYHRFTPECLHRYFSTNELKTVYLSYNHNRNASIYVTGVGVRDQDRWPALKTLPGNSLPELGREPIGRLAVTNPLHAR